MQKRLFDICWSDESKCQACRKEEGTEKRRLYHCPEWLDVRWEIPDAFRKGEQKARTSKDWKWQRGIVTHPFIESQWNRGHSSLKMWQSEKHKSWCMPAEGFKSHVATDGSLLGTAGKWRACGWSVVQLDDEELGLIHGMYGSTEAEFEVQRTIKGTHLTASLCLLKKVIGPIKAHVGNKGIIDGLWRGQRKCIGPNAGDADLWIKIWEELRLLMSK